MEIGNVIDTRPFPLSDAVVRSFPLDFAHDVPGRHDSIGGNERYVENAAFQSVTT
jgi:hypothetical protein